MRPGIGIGIVVRDKLVFAKGYGYRDYGKKLPYTPTTTQPIASNSKLFTAMAAGMLVEEGKLRVGRADPPVRARHPLLQRRARPARSRCATCCRTAPASRATTRSGTSPPSRARSCGTGCGTWSPSAPIRTTFLYNNLMYTAVGYAIEELSGQDRGSSSSSERILDPLGMTRTTLTIEDNIKSAEHAVPYTERRDSTVLYRQPYYTAERAIAPAGAINSSVQDLSHWLIALMNDGVYHGKQVIPKSAISARRCSRRIALPNSGAREPSAGAELLNSAYGMGRWTVSYRGHLLAYHGGDLPGFHSQVSIDAERLDRRHRARRRRPRGAALQRV